MKSAPAYLFFRLISKNFRTQRAFGKRSDCECGGEKIILDTQKKEIQQCENLCAENCSHFIGFYTYPLILQNENTCLLEKICVQLRLFL